MSTIRITRARELAACATLILAAPVCFAGQSGSALPNFLKGPVKHHAHKAPANQSSQLSAHSANAQQGDAAGTVASTAGAKTSQASVHEPSVASLERKVARARQATTGNDVTFEQIKHLNNLLGLLRVRLKVMQIQSKIAAINGSSAVTAAGGGGGGGAGGGSFTSLPKVKVIYGTPGHLTALLAYKDGGTMPVRKGTKLPGGGYVSSITDQSVTLRVSGHSFPLLIQGGGINSISVPTALSFTPPGSGGQGGSSKKHQ